MGAVLSWLGTFLAGLVRGLARDWRAREAIRDQGRAELERRQYELDDEMRQRAAEAAAGADDDPRPANERLRAHGVLRDD